MIMFQKKRQVKSFEKVSKKFGKFYDALESTQAKHAASNSIIEMKILVQITKVKLFFKKLVSS